VADSGDPPELIPARMLNEYVYCQRLFYLEWVDQRWADNEDTTHGSFVHRTVDSRAGIMPRPGATEDAPLTTHSVRLADEELGVVAVIDRVDHRDGKVSSVDYKRGSPMDDGEPWPADRAQALVQAALLRRSGYQVESAIVSYRAAGRRVAIPWHDDLLAEVADLVAGAREVADGLSAPLPLVSSSKCPRCSLVGLCLPDETNALLTRSQLPPRRIVPADPDQEAAYVVEQGAVVSVKGDRLLVRKAGETLVELRLIDVSHVCVLGHVQITTEALTRLWSVGAVVLWMSYGGWLKGWSQGPPGKYVELRRRQVAAHSQGAMLAAPMVAAKVRNQRTMLRRNARGGAPDGVLESMAALARRADSIDSLAELLGVEGAAARLYFTEFTRMLREDSAVAADFDRNGRTRRPAPDPVNSLLGFCYALLVKDVVVTCLGVGLDPYLGVLHRSRYGRPSLALDLAEEFRPLLADSVVLQVLNNGEVGQDDFRRSAVGTELLPAGRRKVIAAYERRMAMQLTHPVFGYKVSYRRCLDVQARIFAAAIIGELPSYTALVTR
jgi:CRISP-associated protein Cas1